MKTVRGRLAPSPTGHIHLGNARTALVTWLSVRSQGGELVWRLEDLDRARCIPGLAEAAREDLEWLGLDWDEGPERGGPYSPYVQSERIELYENALDKLHTAHRIFPCTLSRKDLEGIASAPHGPSEESPYPRSLRPTRLSPNWLDRVRSGAARDTAIRFAVDEAEICFEDLIFGPQCDRVSETIGDFVVRRRDGVFAYQLAVVVDDIAMGITEVVRGADLIDSTGRQIQLIDAFGADRPRYAHVPIVKNARGEKLSKRDAALTVRTLRSRGVKPERVVGYLAHSLGIIDVDEAVEAGNLVGRFAWEKIRRDELRTHNEIAEHLASHQGARRQ